jgi:GTP-binding protein LepA
LCSAKEGTGIVDVLEAIVGRIPPPKGSPEAPLTALIFDAQYDPFRGTIVHVRVFDGAVRPGQTIRIMSNGKTYKVEEVGHFRIQRQVRPALEAGEVGYIIAGIKAVGDTRVGDTVTRDDHPATTPLAGFTVSKPVVFSSIYPVAADDFRSLADALEKYVLNDASLTFAKDSSAALGQGFRCGFLGLLHLEIVQERLEREFDQSIIMTVPSVEYHVRTTDHREIVIDNPAYWPDPVKIEEVQEPYIKASILMPERYIGAVMQLCMKRRAVNAVTSYPTPGRIELTAEMPLAEVLFDFYDRLKSVTQGYGSFDYDLIGYRLADVVKVDILVNGEKVDALSFIVHRESSRPRALHACERLQDEIPRQQFKIAIQGAIGGQIISRTTINPYRKDVTAKCYGGDITRKRKLLEKQKEGKKRMKVVGSVEIPQSAFVAVLKTNDE